jgi:hypothetical protein
MKGSIMQKVEDDRALLKTLWIYLNPTNQEHVEKANLFDFLLLLIFNISRLSENEMCEIFAKHLLEYYSTFFDLQFQEEFSEKEVINNYLTNIVGTWPMKKLILAFKKDHVRRYGQFDRARSVTSMPRLAQILAKDKSFKKIMPVDHRHYHEGTYKELSQQYTFKPQTNKSTVFDKLDVIEEQKKFRA